MARVARNKWVVRSRIGQSFTEYYLSADHEIFQGACHTKSSRWRQQAQPQFATEKKRKKGSRVGLTGNPIGRDKSQGHSSECKVDGVERKKIEEEIG